MLNDIIIVSGRYVIDEELVRRGKEKLFRNLKDLKIVTDSEREIIESIKKSMLRWIDVFNLESLNPRINSGSSTRKEAFL